MDVKFIGRQMQYNYKKKTDVEVKKNNSILEIENKGKEDFIVTVEGFYINLDRKQLKMSFYAERWKGAACRMHILNRKNEILHTVYINEEVCIASAPRIFKVIYVIPPESVCCILSHKIESIENYQQEHEKYFTADSLIISPGYPSVTNKYFWAFVHSRVREYRKAGLEYCIAIPTFIEGTILHTFEGEKVCKINYYDLRELLQRKKIRTILVHFFTDEVAQILSSVSLNEKRIFIYGHSGDILYRDVNKFSTPYFEKVKPLSIEQEQYCERRDKLIKEFNNKHNVKFIFGTEWAKQTSEKENDLVYNNAEIIPCPIDEKIFYFNQKTKEQRKKIVIIRKFDNINTYGVDLNIKCILELSKRPFFEDLSFEIYGEGNYHDVLLEPVKQFENVHIYKHYLTHNEMATVHKENGIALFSTRYETQGIAASEAAMSGLIVLTNNVAAVPNVFDSWYLCEEENYVEMADKVEYLYYNPDEFVARSKEIHNWVKERYGMERWINREIEMLKYDMLDNLDIYHFPEQNAEILLSVIVPAYNAEQWLQHGVESLISARNADKIEVLIINDGSQDDTAKIGGKLQKLTTKKGKSIVRVINKENGGHGSTINVGIKEAKGKYLKLMDADDYYDTIALDTLLFLLEKENSDIVLTDYVEDLATNAKMIPIENYKFMEPGKQYNLEDLCFEGYGFNRYANILHTSTYRTDMLKKGGFEISEHCFYVDMEMNTFSFILARTVTYYPLQLYIYYLGRSGQSVSPASFKKNYRQHEHVLLRLIKEIEKVNVSYGKKKCLYRTIILPMVETQYYICTEYLDDGEVFVEFDNEIEKYPDIYNHPFIANDRVKFHRKTKGKNITKRSMHEKIRGRLDKFLPSR